MGVRGPRRGHLSIGLTAALAATVLIVGGCSSSSGSGGSSTRLSATALDGHEISIPDGKPTVLYFFSATCSQGMLAVAQAQRDTPAATYVAVDLDPDRSTGQIRDEVDTDGASQLAVLADPQAALMTRYGVDTIGTTVVLDAAGKPVYQGIEASSAQISSALARAGSA